MNHRELYRSIVPEDTYIITYSDLARASTCASAKRIAAEVYYKMGDGYTNDSMRDGTDVHSLKENELSKAWSNEVRLAYKMSDNYYLCGTIDRYHITNKSIEDFKHTKAKAKSYLKTKQIETYSFLAMNCNLVVEDGRYTTIDKDGEILDSAPVCISEDTVASCCETFILPRFNMIKDEIEILRNKFTIKEIVS